MEVNEQLNLSSVIEIASPWKEKCTASYLSKIIRLENDCAAMVIKDECSKPLRFLYLALLMSKKNSHNMNILMSKLGQIRALKTRLNFVNMTPDMSRLVGINLENMLKELVELHKKLEQHGYLHNTILKLTHEFAIIDPLLILTLRAVADDYKMTQALDCSSTLGLGQIEVLLNKFFVDKGALINNRNKYVLFWPLTEIQFEYFRSKSVPVLKQKECFEELSDSQTLRYQEHIMIEKLYSLL